MTETDHENPQPDEDQEMVSETIKNDSSCQQPAESRSSAGNFREAAYVVLFIAAVFVINAMETGSYRTPWPVAIVTALAGFGLLGYSFMEKSKANH